MPAWLPQCGSQRHGCGLHALWQRSPPGRSTQQGSNPGERAAAAPCALPECKLGRPWCPACAILEGHCAAQLGCAMPFKYCARRAPGAPEFAFREGTGCGCGTFAGIRALLSGPAWWGPLPEGMKAASMALGSALREPSRHWRLGRRATASRWLRAHFTTSNAPIH